VADTDTGESGMVSISYVLAAGFAMIFFAILANFVVIQYASGAVRAALDEGVRNGARADAGVAVCMATIDDILASVLGGPYGDDVAASCQDTGDVMVASAQATFRGFAPLVPDLTIDFEAVAAREQFVGPSVP
jgi:hypothetical protein